MPFVPHLYPVFMKVLQDEDSEVRGNCTYALGVLAEFGGDPIYAYPLVRKKERKKEEDGCVEGSSLRSISSCTV